MEKTYEYLKKAEIALKEKDVARFIKNITMAKYSASNSEEDKTVFVEQVCGLISLGEYSLAMETLEDPIILGLSQTEHNHLLYQKALVLVNLGDYNKAIELLEALAKDESLEVSTRANSGLAWVYMQMFHLNKNAYLLMKAESYCHKVLSLVAESDQTMTRLRIRALVTLGAIYKSQNDLYQSLNAYKSALQISRDEKTLNQMATLYAQLGYHAKAHKYFEEAEKLATQNNNYTELYTNHLLRGQIAEYHTIDYHQAKDQYLVAFDFAVVAGDMFAAYNSLLKILKMDYIVTAESIDFLLRRNNPYKPDIPEVLD